MSEKRLRRFVACLSLSFALSATASAAERAAPPNILIIVSDDQGYRDLGCFGSDEVLTPHLDEKTR